MGTLLIGATGLVGANLAHLLSRRKERFRGLVRPGSDRRGLRGLQVEEVEGDLLDPRSLERAMEGIRRVYHCAGLVRYDPASAAALKAANVEGTGHVLAAARKAGARVVYVSSTAAVARGTLAEPGSEDDALTGAPPSPYHASKREAEEVARAAAAEGAEVVICNPALVFGAYDVKPTSGALLLAVCRGLGAAFPTGGTSAVNAADVAAGLHAAMERGRRGERYILGGENLTYRELLTIAAEEAGVSPPRVPIPDGALAFAGHLAGAARAIPLQPFRAWDPGLSAVPLLAQPSYVTSTKAVNELGYQSRPVRLGIRDALRWFQEEGILPRERPLAPRSVVER